MAGASSESEREMRDAARSGRKRWELSNWDLRWKVTAVLAVPLAVAVGLGVSRISAEWTEANRLGAAAENVAYIPTITALSAATSTVAGSAVIEIAPGRSMVADKDLSALDQALSDANAMVGELDEVPEAHDAVTEMIDLAEGVRANGKSVSDLPAAEAAAQIDLHRSAGVRAVEAVASEVSNPSIDPAKLRLVDSLNARANLLGEVVGLADIMRDPGPGMQTYEVAASTERNVLNMLAQRYPSDDSNIAALRNGIEERLQVLTGPQAEAGQLPLESLRRSLLETNGLETYEKLVTESTDEIDNGVQSLADNAFADAIIYSIVVLLTILAALLLAVFVARSMIVPLHRLRLAALRVAESDLPHEVAQLRTGASPEQVPLDPMPIRSDEEIGQLARAVDDIHGQALRLASDQAQMRSQVNDMFETLARRSKSLVDHQLTLIEAMEYDEKDPRLLENLFRLDHLAARMRRNGDNLLILAGTKQRRSKSAPVEIADVLRAAISEVEDYERVKLGATPRGALKEPAASDLAHLFAELLDNALRASPPETDVKFTFAQAHDQGLLVEVADRGIGMPPNEMADINRRLENTAEPGPDTARHMGLFVVGRLAERHGLSVRLRPTFDTARDPGVTVTVHVPIGLIVAGQTTIMAAATGSGPQPAVSAGAPKQSEQQPAQQRKSVQSAMQAPNVSRTPTGNMMVTMDPSGVGGQAIAPSADSGPSTGAGPSAGEPGTGSLPQRQPGAAMAAGLRGEEDATTSLRSASEQAGAPETKQPSMPQRGKLAAASMPKRNITGGMPTQQPPGQPGQPGQPPAGGAPAGNTAEGGMPQRHPGVGDSPANPSGLPQRQPGGNSAPARETEAGAPRPSGPPGPPPGVPSAPGTGGPAVPQRENAAPRSGPSGLPQRKPEGGANGGSAPEGPASGLPARQPGSGAPTSETHRPTGPHGNADQPGQQQGPPESPLPQRMPRTGSLPQRGTDPNNVPPAPEAPSAGTGLGGQRGGEQPPRRDSVHGGLPQREPRSGGLPQHDSTAPANPEQGDPTAAPPRPPSGLPQRRPGSSRVGESDTAAGSDPLPQRSQSPGSETGLPQRGAASGGEPRHDPLFGDLPRHESDDSGLPQRGTGESGDAGPSQREPVENGLPQRDPSGVESGRGLSPSGLPQRDPSGGEPGRGGLPQRQPGASGYGEPGAAGGADPLPQREPGTSARQPGGSGLSQRQPTVGNSAQTAPPSGANPSPDPQQQREPTSGGLPQREPGAHGRGPRLENGPGVALPQRNTGDEQTGPGSSAAEGAEQGEQAGSRETGRHSVRPSAEKTASFFQTKLQPAPESEDSPVMGGTPIFAEMMSAWLSDPSTDRSETGSTFETRGDEGWQAARHASEAEAQGTTAAGLPQRNPGGRLVPGAVGGAEDRSPSRDPDSIKSSLSRHQQGVRDGRAMKAMNLTGDKGDR